jgi:flagellin-specific chaperone FliS
MPYIEEELKFATNEQRVVVVHEHLLYLVSKAKDALKNPDETKYRGLIDTIMDAVATLDMHLDFRANNSFATMIRRWYGFWTIRLLDARMATGQKALDVLQDLENSIREFVLALREGMAQRWAQTRAKEENKGASDGVSFKA